LGQVAWGSGGKPPFPTCYRLEWSSLHTSLFHTLSQLVGFIGYPLGEAGFGFFSTLPGPPAL
jgi:hypothetical protein